MFRTADKGAAVGRISLTAHKSCGLRYCALSQSANSSGLSRVGRFAFGSLHTRPHTKRRSRRGSLITMTTASRATWKAIGGLSALLAAASLTHAQAPPAFTVISPIYGQLVRFSMPSNFSVVYE